ncbi:MAG: cyclic pyranopterin monophosphate synthase MoaC [Phycisphaerales bacterium]|nr:cyclic pyranopterin monophosphate synthase MoaC [Phycisphaerales bacterium]
MAERLTHLDDRGKIQMVDVSNKPSVRRRAVARCTFQAAPETIELIMKGSLPKGEALVTARLAGIQAAKRVDVMIPLCHTLPLEHVDVQFSRVESGIEIEASAVVTSRTGVEMEALTAASVAALTLWDMTKAVDATLSVTNLELVLKEKDDSV